MPLADQLVFSAEGPDGLVPAIVADRATGRALTLCYLNREALARTLETGFVHLFRRSAGQLQKKGDTSGHVQRVREIRADCEGKSLLLLVDQEVAACHAGYFSCYFRRYDPAADALREADPRVFDPGKAYGKKR